MSGYGYTLYFEKPDTAHLEEDRVSGTAGYQYPAIFYTSVAGVLMRQKDRKLDNDVLYSTIEGQYAENSELLYDLVYKFNATINTRIHGYYTIMLKYNRYLIDEYDNE